jgi:hypothetical protein
MAGFRILRVMCLSTGLLFVPIGFSKGAIFLTVNGQDLTSITLELGQSCSIEIVSNDSNPYGAWVGLDVVGGTFTHTQTMPAAGSNPYVDRWEAIAVYYELHTGTNPTPGVHFVFQYVAGQAGEFYLFLCDEDFIPIDSVTIRVPGPQPEGTNLIYNGYFELGNIGFETGYTYSPESLGPEGVYNIDNNPHNYHGLFASYGDHTSGQGLMMVVNGHPDSNVVVWQQSVTVSCYTYYTFSFGVANCFAPSPAELECIINDISLGVSSAPAAVGQWLEVSYQWSSDSNTTANIKIIDRNTERYGNDFTLDDIILRPCSPTIEPSGQPVSQNILVSQSVSFTVTATGTEPLHYQWYKDDQPISNSDNNVLTISSAQLSDAGSYKVVVSNDCNSVTSNSAILTVSSAGPRIITFAGRDWYVSTGHYDPGPNYWSDSNSSVWVDTSGLHLKIRNDGNTWYAAQIYSTKPTTIGMHRFYIDARLDLLDQNVVFSPFLYNNNTKREIDIEFARWGNLAKPIGWYISWLNSSTRDVNSFDFTQTNGTYTTHYLDWEPNSIRFKSFYGHYLEPPDPTSDYLIQDWYYQGSYVPPCNSQLVIVINLWLDGGTPPSDGQEVEVIITGADLPVLIPGDLNGSKTVDFQDLALLASQWLLGTLQNCPSEDLTRDCVINFADFALLAQHWLEGTTF